MTFDYSGWDDEDELLAEIVRLKAAKNAILEGAQSWGVMGGQYTKAELSNIPELIRAAYAQLAVIRGDVVRFGYARVV